MSAAADDAGRAVGPDADAAAAALRQRFLNAMSHAACTVSVVTTDGPAGRFGLTVSAMSSVSADGPAPTLLVCINQRSSAADAFLANGVFCVNVLRDDQAYVSDTFAGRTTRAGTPAPDRFACASWTTMATGAPRIVEPLAAFDCRIVSIERVGTHFVVVGAVASVFVSPSGGAPLIYANHAYGTPQRLTRPLAARTGAAQTLSLGCLQSIAPCILPAMIAQLAAAHPQFDIELLEGDQQYVLGSLRGGEVELAVLYDIGLPDDIATLATADLDTHVVLPQDHRLAQQAQIGLEDLAAEPLILLDVVPSREAVLALFRERGLAPLLGYRTTSLEMVRGMVANGLGYSLLGARPAQDISYDGRPLVTRPLSGTTAPGRLVLAHRAGQPLSAAALACAQHCIGYFGDHRF